MLAMGAMYSSLFVEEQIQMNQQRLDTASLVNDCSDLYTFIDSHHYTEQLDDVY